MKQKALFIHCCWLVVVGLVGTRLLVLSSTGQTNLPPKHPGVGKPFTPIDVAWGQPVYRSNFRDPAALGDWRLEGGLRMTVQEGRLVLESPSGARTPEDNTGHLVCWLDREIPADFLLEFTFRPANRKQGLAIVFFNTRGIHGESLFDPALKPRDGTFTQYLRSDLNNYHVSYWAGDRGTSHLRKSYGAHVLAVGDDLVWQAPPDVFQTIRIYKRGGMIRVTVDGIIATAYDDDGVLHGPVWNQSGWIGLRQMSHTERGEYGQVTVWPLVTHAAPAAVHEGRHDSGSRAADRRPYQKGRLLFRDDFEDLSQWHVEMEEGGAVFATNGNLVINVPRGCTAWFRPPLSGPVLIEYEATVVDEGGPNDRVSDLNCFWMAHDTRSPDDVFQQSRSGKFSDYNLLQGYYVGLGANNNTTTRFRRYIGHTTLRPLLPEHDLRDARHLLRPNVTQRISLMAFDGLIEYHRDGEVIFSYTDNHPYTNGWFALRTVHNHMRVAKLRIFELITVSVSLR